MIIRKAKQSDCKDIFKWRNDHITREMSFNKNIITYKVHRKWFFEALQDFNKVFYIGELDNYKIGVCRFDYINLKLASEVSINMNPDARGKGLSKFFLKSSIVKYLRNNKNDIIANVRNENLPSIKIFMYSGFKIIEEKNNRIYFKKHINSIDLKKS